MLLDRVVAIVDDEALTQYEVDDQKKTALSQMKAQNLSPPPADVLDKQVLDRLITERAVLHFAKENGVRVDDTQVERTILRIAQDNKMTADEFRRVLGREGIAYDKYREDIRKEIVIQRLREREVEQRISVSDAEVDAFLASQNAQAGGDVEYRLAHILVLVPERATPEQIDAKRQRAEEALKQVKDGTDFGQVAAGFSDAQDALQGGSLGWRTPARMPAVFSETVRKMQPGEVSDVLRTASGFHIVKVQETRSRNAPTVVEQTRVRHILIKVSEVVSEAEAKARIDRIRDRIETGAKFEDQAKLNSEDATLGQRGRPRLGLARRHGARLRGGDEQAQDRRGLAAGAHAVRLAPDAGQRAPHAGHHRGAQARPGAPGAPPAQVRRGVPGVAAPDARPRLRRDQARRVARRP